MKMFDINETGFEGCYKACEDGRIYSVERKDRLGRFIGGKFLAPCENKNTGYVQVVLKANGKEKTRQIHTLIATVFLEKPTNCKTCEVNHKDGNKHNNAVTNLEWVSHSDNIKHQYHTLGRVMTESHKKALLDSVKGVKHTRERILRKSISQSILYGRYDEVKALSDKGVSRCAIAQKYKCSEGAVGRLLRKELAWQQ